MPILRIDIWSVTDANRQKTVAGKRFFPANDRTMDEVRLRWCGQCRLEDDCPIKAKVDMMLALSDNDFTGVLSDAIIKEHDRRPKEWIIQANGQPRCESMQLIGVEKDERSKV